MLDEIRSILIHARARDLAEIVEVGESIDSVVESFRVPWATGRIFEHNGRPTAVLAFREITPSALGVAMFSTSDCVTNANTDN